MFNTNIIEAVTERDIDLLLLEELNTSSQFATWFYKKILQKPPVLNIVKAYHSVSDPNLGESDIIILYNNSHAILVENKISAITQPNQARRYILRGDKGITSRFWGSYSTCIIAPEKSDILYN